MKYLYPMKKWILLALLVLVLYSSYTLFIKVTHFNTEKASFQYNAGGLDALADSLSAKKIIRDKTSFLVLAKLLNVEDRIKPGKFLIDKKTSLLNLIRILRNNQQARVKFILNKVRTKADLAKLIANTFAIDSTSCMQYLNSNDSLAPFDTDTTQVLSLFIPNTYEFYWSTPMTKILQKMKTEESLFWSKNNRLAKAASIGLSKNEVYTLASIVEEETNYDSDKTIDLVLNAPNTNYYYFVAKADFSGYHHFSATYEEHNKFAKDYQLKLDEYQAKKNK